MEPIPDAWPRPSLASPGAPRSADRVDQVLVCIEGEGLAVLEDQRSPVHPGHLVHVPAGTRHNLVNAGTGDLMLFTVYAPRQHAEGATHRTKAEADASEEHC